MMSIVLTLSRYGALTAAVLTVVAIFLYPGGTSLNPTTRGYSFFQNSLSDLGSTVAWNGQANPSASVHFAASSVLVAAALGCFGVLIRIYSTSPIARWSSRIAGAVLVLAGVGVIGVALTPYDRDAPLHGRFTLLAVSAFPIATSLLCVATLVTDRLRRRVAVGWCALTAVVVVWASTMLQSGPMTAMQLAIPVTLQKLVAGALVAIIVFQSREAERALLRDTTEPTSV
jgi:hypothetical membrane protein